MGDTVGEVLEAEDIEVTRARHRRAVARRARRGRRPDQRPLRAAARAHRRRQDHDPLGLPHRGRDGPRPSSARRFGGAGCRPAVAPRSTAAALSARGGHPQEADARDRRQEAGHPQDHRAHRRGRADGDATSTSTSDETKPALERPTRRRRPGRLHRHARRRRSGSSARPSTSAPSSRRTTRCTRARPSVVREGSDGMRNVTYQVCLPQRRARRPQGDPPGRAPQAGLRDRRTSAPRRRPTALRQHGVGRARAVRVRRQLGHQHRQRLLRRPAVQPRHLAVVRRHRAARARTPARPRSRSRPSSATRRAATAPGRAVRPASACPM